MRVKGVCVLLLWPQKATEDKKQVSGGKEFPT